MPHTVKDIKALRKILVVDVVAGGSTALIGLLLFNAISPVMGLSVQFIVVVSAITLLYAIGAATLLLQGQMSISLLRTLVAANWIWAAISVVLLIVHMGHVTALGMAFLVLQVVVVGLLAYLEGAQLVRTVA